MSSTVSIELLPLSDPRGAQKQPVPLAPRLKDLKGKSTLLFDNSQLTGHIHHYGPLLDWLEGYLTQKHGAACSRGTQNLFDVSRDEMIALAEGISKSGAQAVVIALCKGGMTQPTSLFAVELERRGLPCVLVCTGHAVALASGTAASFVPGLPIVVAKMAAPSEDQFGKAEAEAIAPEIVAGMTKDAAELLREFQERYAGSAVAANGNITLPDVVLPATDSAGKTVVKLDPAQFAAEFYERMCDADMCDGFPVIPPTQRRVDDMLAHTDRDPELVLVADCPPSGSSITIRSLAVNAVMAGCKPEYFPILVTAFEAISDPEYRLFQGAITTHPSGNAVVVSGPLARELGIHSGGGCLGPGFRANATIGRAVNLTIMNVTRAIPDKSDMSVFGSPAEFTFCFAESDEHNPWQPLHTDLYGPEVTSVTVHKCESPHNVVDPRNGPEALMRAIASTAATLGGNNLTHLGQLLILLNPDHAEMLAEAKWSKRDVKEFLYEIARHPQAASTRRVRPVFPPYFHKLDMVPVMRSPDDVFVLVGGRRGPHSMVAIPWGLSSAVSRAVTTRDGAPILTLKGR